MAYDAALWGYYIIVFLELEFELIRLTDADWTEWKVTHTNSQAGRIEWVVLIWVLECTNKIHY
jgi:hypothetical protein